VKKVILVLFLTFYGYAIIRYHIGKNISGLMAFFFVLNKAFAWTAGTLLILSILPSYFLEKYKLKRRAIGLFAYTIALIHINSSILLLNEKFYPNFYSHSCLNLNGWLYITLGVLSILLFTIPLIASKLNLPEGHFMYRFGRYGILMNLAHVAAIGFKGWLSYQDWPYFMPPITLLFVFSGLLILGLRYLILRK
jgi:hypothetical protein